MGCDGGSIPRRNEVVKSKNKDETGDKHAALAAKWHFCHISGLPLAKPIVACQLGYLYNKDRLIEHLLEARLGSQTPITHLKSLKDVKELKLVEKLDSGSNNHQISAGKEKFRAQYVCPISGLDMNGKYKFYYSMKCGCVISEKAIKEVPDYGICILCQSSYDPKLDLIIINGNEDEVEEMTKKIQIRKEINTVTKHSSKQLNINEKKNSQTNNMKKKRKRDFDSDNSKRAKPKE